MKRLKLITEMSQDISLIEESNKDMYIVGIYSSANIENSNKRKYSKELLEREEKSIQEKINAKSLWGELGHPPNPEINPDKIAILTTMLEWKGGNLYGKSKVLNTPMGNIAKTLIKEGRMGISSRGLGTVSDDGWVNEDFKLLTYDLVTDPSNDPSWVSGIYEGKEFVIKELMDNQKDEEFSKEELLEQARKHLLNDRMSYLDKILKEMGLV